MPKFIYVFSEESVNTLKSLGYVLLKEDIKNSIYVFENKKDLKFGLSSTDYVLGNTLTF